MNFPLLVDDRWTQRVAAHPVTLSWLRELDADASHLTMWLTANYARSFRRLGFYFACVRACIRDFVGVMYCVFGCACVQCVSCVRWPTRPPSPKNHTSALSGTIDHNAVHS